MDSELIKFLEKLLDKAHHGEIVAIAVATCCEDLGTINAYYMGDRSYSELLGAVEILKWRLLTDTGEKIYDV